VQLRSHRVFPLRRLMREAGRIAGVLLVTAGAVQAAPLGPASELSPDMRPVLVLQPPQGQLQLVHPGARPRDRKERLAPLPAAWQTPEADRGFTQALLMQLSHAAANWPWRSLIVSASGPESDSQLQSLSEQDAVLAVVQDELVDLGGKVQFQVTMELTTVRAIATAHERRVHTHVEYLTQALPADSEQPRRNLAPFAQDGTLDAQVSTAATDLSQFLATIVARVSVPNSLHPHNPTLGGLGLHPSCSECRASDRVVYLQPGRVWVRAGKASGSILALPLKQTTQQGRIFRP
jgi:hypothetical protein